jgi:hypothetical protein
MPAVSVAVKNSAAAPKKLKTGNFSICLSPKNGLSQ